MIRTIKTLSVLTFRSCTSFTMRFLVLLVVIALCAPGISAQFDTAYIPDITTYDPDDIPYYSDQTQYYTKEIQYYPDEAQYYPDATKYNPDEPLVAPPIQSADDDATACDNGSADGRNKRACCQGNAEGRIRDGGYLRVFKCRKCTFRSLSSHNFVFSNQLHVRKRLARRAGLQSSRCNYMVLRGHCGEFHRSTICSWRGFLSTPEEFWCHDARDRRF